MIFTEPPRSKMLAIFRAGFGWEDAAAHLAAERDFTSYGEVREFRERVHQVFRRWLQERAEAAA